MYLFQDDFAGGGVVAANGGFPDFNLCRIFKKCKGLKIFTVEFKDGLMVTPPVSYVGKFKFYPVHCSLIIKGINTQTSLYRLLTCITSFGIIGTESLPSIPSSSNLYVSGTALDTLVHVQLGQNVQNSAISTILSYCPHLRHIHCNRCPDLQVLEKQVLNKTNIKPLKWMPLIRPMISTYIIILGH